MTDTPDPMTKYPQVRKWAERFYAVKGWAMAAPTAGGAVEARRNAAKAALGTISIGSTFLPEVRRAFDGGVKALRDAIAKGAVATDFDTIDADIASLKADIAAQELIAAARAKSETALAAAEAKFAAVQPVLDEGGLVFLEGKLKAARTTHGKAATAPAFGDAEKLAADFLPLADDAAKYGNSAETWAAAALAFIAVEYPAGAGRDAVEATRVAVRATAVGKSKTGDFVGAEAALLGFPGDAKAPDFTLARKFNETLARFEAESEAKCAEVTSSDLEGASGHANDAKAARKLGLKDKKYNEGINKITALEAWCLPRLNLARRFKAFDKAMGKHKGFRDAVALMNADQKADKFIEAIAKLDAIDADPAMKDENASRVIDKRLKARVDALLLRLPPALKKKMEKAWTTHADAVKAGDFATAKGQAAILTDMLLLEPVVDMKAEVDAIWARYPASKAYEYMKDYRAAGQAGNYALARKEIDTNLPLLRQLADYLDVVAEAGRLKAALPADPPALHGGLDAALAAADVKAKARKPKEAADDLRGVMAGADYFGMAAAIADWTAKDAAVAKTQARVVKFVALAGPVKTLQDALDTARKPAVDNQAYAESFLALVQHEALLAEAQAFAAMRRQVQGIQAAVLKAAKANPALLDPAPKTENDLKDSIAAAEALAVAGKFKEAEAAFAKIRTDCAALSKKTAEHYETADAVGSNAGHSLDRHGPDVALPDLIKRLQTGIPPNAKTPDERAFTGGSSKFKSPQDWLAGRELAAAAALAKGVDVEATAFKPPFDAMPTAIDFTVDHGKPIDEIFLGRKKNQKFDPATGEFTPDKTYESFEAMSGLTRAYVNWIWEFEELANVDVPNDPADLSKGTTKKNVKAKDTADYLQNYKWQQGDPAAEPPEIKGRWVMMQQYPVADGWDDALKSYKTDPKDLIP